jgi:hypothetical protein
VNHHAVFVAHAIVTREPTGPQMSSAISKKSSGLSPAGFSVIDPAFRRDDVAIIGDPPFTEPR